MTAVVMTSKVWNRIAPEGFRQEFRGFVEQAWADFQARRGLN